MHACPLDPRLAMHYSLVSEISIPRIGSSLTAGNDPGSTHVYVAAMQMHTCDGIHVYTSVHDDECMHVFHWDMHASAYVYVRM